MGERGKKRDMSYPEEQQSCGQYEKTPHTARSSTKTLEFLFLGMRGETPQTQSTEQKELYTAGLIYACTYNTLSSTRDVEVFFKKTAIAYRPNTSERANFRWYATTVFF